MREPTDLIIANAEIAIGSGPQGEPFHPTIHACEVRLPADGFQRIVGKAFPVPLDLTHLTIAPVSCRLIDGGVEAVVRARRGFLDQNVTTRVELIPAGNGDLRVTVTYMRVGFFAASWLLEYILGAVNRQPGLRQSRPKSIDVNVAVLLRSLDVPITWDSGVTHVSASSAEFVLTMR